MDRRTYRNNYSGKGSSCHRVEPCKEVCKEVCKEACKGHLREDMCDRRDGMCERERMDGDFGRFPLAMCYVPWQCFRNLYEDEFEALANGTLFKELDLKWYGRGCK